MTALTRRLMLGVTAAALVTTGAHGAIIFAGPTSNPPPPGPSGVLQSPSSLPSVLANTPDLTVLAALTAVNGQAPFTFGVSGGTGGALLDTSGANVIVKSGASPLAPGTYTYFLSVTDALFRTYNDPVAHTFIVPAGPTSIASAPDDIFDNAAPGTIATTYSGVGGSGGGTYTKNSGFTKFSLDPTTGQLTYVSGTLTAGVPETGTVSYTDRAGLSVGPIAKSITVLDHASSVLIAQVVAINDGGGAASAGWISQTFGHEFDEGDVATATNPDFRLQDGTSVPYSMSVAARSKFYPTDGSLAQATFMLRVPAATPAPTTLTCSTTSGSPNVTVLSGSTASIEAHLGVFGSSISLIPTGVLSITNSTQFLLTQNAVKTGTFTLTFAGLLVDIKTNGSGPGTNSRSTADFTAGGLDIKNTAVYQNGGSGTAICSLAYAIAHARPDDYLFMSGAAGSCWVFPTAPYTVSGVEDPLLNAHVAAYALEDSSGGLYGTRELILPSNGFADVAGNNWKSFSSIITDDGLGHSFDCYDVTTIGSTRNCNAATIGNNQFSLSGGTGLDGGELVKVAGSPPAPLVAGNYYFAQKVSSTKFQLGLGSSQGSARIVPTSTGGSWTVTAFFWLVPFGTQADAGPSARPRFYQGAGSVSADVASRIYKNPYYRRSTGFLPPFDCEGADYQHDGTRPVPSNKTSTYFAGTSQPLGQRSLGGVSPEPTGYDLWSSNDFFNQTPTTQRNVAMAPLIGIQFGIRLRSGQSATRGRCIPVNNTDYTGAGLPASRPTMQYGGGSGGTNFPAGCAPTTTSILLPGFDAQTFDHWFAWFTGAVDQFREPHHLDWMIDDACHAMFERGINSAVNTYSATQWSPGGTKICSNAGFGITRYCINMGSSLQNGRYDAWAWRTHMHGAWRIPTGYQEYQYHHDVADDGIANTVEMIANMQNNPVAADLGFWLKGPSNFFFDGWQVGYYGQGMAAAANYVKHNANALVGVKQTLKFATRLAAVLGFPLAYAQETPIAAVSTLPKGALIADTSLLASESITVSWNSGTPTFTWVNFATDKLHTQGTYDCTKSVIGSADYFIFTNSSPPSESIKKPGGATEMVKYYMKPLSTSTFELHLQANFGDAAFQPNDTNSSATWFRVVDFTSKLQFPASYNIKDQFYNTIWDAVATALAWGQSGADPTGLSMWVDSWQACLTAGLLDQNTQGGGANYLNVVL
jgi:hypothetical protein